MKINIFIHTTSQLPIQHWLAPSIPYLIHNMVASYFPHKIVDYNFYQENEAGEQFKFNFLNLQFLASQLTFVSSKQEKYRCTYGVSTVKVAILYGIRYLALYLASCSSVHVYIKGLSKLDVDPISFQLLFICLYGYYIILVTWQMAFNLKKS